MTRITDEKTRALAEIKILGINNNIFLRDEDMISMAHLFYSFLNEIVFSNGTDTVWITGLKI